MYLYGFPPGAKRDLFLGFAIDINFDLTFFLIFLIFIFVSAFKILQKDGREEGEKNDIAEDHENYKEHDGDMVRD